MLLLRLTNLGKLKLSKIRETVTKSPVVKEEKKVEEPQLPKVGNQQEVKTTAGKAEETIQPVAQPLVKIPEGTIQGVTVEGPKYSTMEQHTIYGETVKVRNIQRWKIKRYKVKSFKVQISQQWNKAAHH